MASEKEQEFSEKQRAEDIILGALGFGEDAKITSIQKTVSLANEDGYSGTGVFSDGEAFEFCNEDPLTDLDRWALLVLLTS